MNSDTPRRLGRGLEALINSRQTPSSPAARSETPDRVPIADIKPNPFQPRRNFNPAELKELEDSLRTTGLLQPITVRKSPTGPGFELATGERRLRAATNLGWKDIPANVRELNDQELLAVALVENLQRADLNPVEEAQGYARLIADFGQTQQSVATLVGKDRSTVANMLRILQLPVAVRAMLQSASISLGHARALLALPTEPEMLHLASEITSAGLSVREVEKRVRVRKPTVNSLSGNRTHVTASPSGRPASDAQLTSLTDKLRRRLQTDVKVSLTGADRGTISISFFNADDLERLLDLILGTAREPH